jgi:hypothetical protein
MNTYIFKLTDGSEIEIQAATRVCALEIFEDMYYEDGKWKVEVKDINVK